jgi:hypothetical protein
VDSDADESVVAFFARLSIFPAMLPTTRTRLRLGRQLWSIANDG